MKCLIFIVLTIITKMIPCQHLTSLLPIGQDRIYRSILTVWLISFQWNDVGENTILKLLEKQVKFQLVEPLHLMEQMTLVVDHNFFSVKFSFLCCCNWCFTCLVETEKQGWNQMTYQCRVCVLVLFHHCFSFSTASQFHPAGNFPRTLSFSFLNWEPLFLCSLFVYFCFMSVCTCSEGRTRVLEKGYMLGAWKLQPLKQY